MTTYEDAERAAIRAESGCATPEDEPVLAAHRPDLHVVPGDRAALEVSTRLIRRFLGVAENEPIELCAFVRGRPWIYQCTGHRAHVVALRAAEQIRDYAGAYQLANGPIDPALIARYPQDTWQPAHNGRASDRDIGQLRAVYIDVDPIRPKGISATDDQLRAAWEVSHEMETWLAEQLGSRAPIGHGCSGNGYFALLAIEPTVPTSDTTTRIARLLTMLHRRFSTDAVKIDTSVSNPARLMPAPATWKRKGRHTPERPHRKTSFCCSGNVQRIPLEALA